MKEFWQICSIFFLDVETDLHENINVDSDNVQMHKQNYKNIIVQKKMTVYLEHVKNFVDEKAHYEFEKFEFHFILQLVDQMCTCRM